MQMRDAVTFFCRGIQTYPARTDVDLAAIFCLFLSCFAFHWKNAITVAMRLVLEEPLTCSYS
jgi:hypothetical protein